MDSTTPKPLQCTWNFSAFIVKELWTCAWEFYICVFLDDILIFSRTPEEHVEYVKFALKKLREHTLKAKLTKYGYGFSWVEYLGHIVENSTIRADTSKIAAVMD